MRLFFITLCVNHPFDDFFNPLDFLINKSEYQLDKPNVIQ